MAFSPSIWISAAAFDEIDSQESELLSCTNNVNQESQWGENLPGLYDGTQVIQIDGEKAIQTLEDDKLALGNPDLVVAYHPQCPHCHTMVHEYTKLSEYVKQHNIPVNVMSINMSKTMKYADQLGINSYPTVRLYKSRAVVREFEEKRNFDNLVEFLKTNGIKM
eukprot:CAMPEP_0168611854 /NCGR_PEP_ID=MMETSP0449_2-20121227/2588_1 /TAXON_ID=1082188 /ORGANISM="Strombidium rassoulzadegani, Strain ras09" /LENGTH=163 /DNA_ID=CAMNT_0008652345 /DNA_START=1 /DNA_END=489 /DNA_ORIENTATION=-